MNLFCFTTYYIFLLIGDGWEILKGNHTNLCFPVLVLVGYVNLWWEPLFLFVKIQNTKLSQHMDLELSVRTMPGGQTEPHHFILPDPEHRRSSPVLLGASHVCSVLKPFIYQAVEMYKMGRIAIWLHYGYSSTELRYFSLGWVWPGVGGVSWSKNPISLTGWGVWSEGCGICRGMVSVATAGAPLKAVWYERCILMLDSPDAPCWAEGVQHFPSVPTFCHNVSFADFTPSQAWKSSQHPVKRTVQGGSHPANLFQFISWASVCTRREAV